MLAEENSEGEQMQLPLDSGRNSHNSQNSGESFASSAARSTSINLDARSDISEATTVSLNKRIVRVDSILALVSFCCCCLFVFALVV